MNYKTFKAQLSLVTKKDVKIVRDEEDEALKVLVKRAIEDVADWTLPLTLVSSNISDEIHIHIGNGLLIRKPKKITDDDSLIDIDEDLVLAVIYNVAKILGSRDYKKDYISEESKIITSYNTKRHELLESGEIDLSRTALENALNLMGSKKIYTAARVTLTGVVFDWDLNFIDITNNYLSGKREELSKSDRNNLDLFISFATGQMTTNDENYIVFEEFNKYLGSL